MRYYRNQGGRCLRALFLREGVLVAGVVMVDMIVPLMLLPEVGQVGPSRGL